MNIRDRIKEFRRVPARELQPNPKNWRVHPQAQQDALRGLLAEVGYVDALLARETADGGLMLIDGHLRAETTPDAEVPVLILDVDETDADKILATFDPLSAMATVDTARLNGLLQDVKTGSAAVHQMLADLAEANGLLPELEPQAEPEIKEQWSVLVECEDEGQQAELLERLEQEGFQCRALIA